jgi:hypothetical protein
MEALRSGDVVEDLAAEGEGVLVVVRGTCLPRPRLTCILEGGFLGLDNGHGSHLQIVLLHAYYQGLSCPLRKKSSAYIGGRGPKGYQSYDRNLPAN